MSKEKAGEVVTLYWAHPSWQKTGPGIIARPLQYRREQKTFIAIETNDTNIPFGMRRVPVKDMPKAGGFTGFGVLAYAREEAMSKVRAMLKARIEALRKESAEYQDFLDRSES